LSKTTSRLLKFISYVLDYAPIIATVVVATLASLSAVRSGITTGEMLQWVLVVLALLATTQLVDRFRLMRSLDAKVEQLLDSAQGLKGASAFFVQRIPDMEERLRQAKSISINGITLSRTSDSFWGTFKQRIVEGAKIRILIVDPNHQALDIAVNRFHKHQDLNRLRRESEHALDNFESLMAEQTANKAFQVRLLPFVPPYGIWLIDADTPRAEIWVELYSFRDEPEPTFHLLPNRDGEWFAFFQRQFEIMWNASKEWSPQKNAAA